MEKMTRILASIDGRLVAARRNKLKDYYQMTKWFWVILALTSLTIQATVQSTPGPVHSKLLNTGELAITSHSMSRSFTTPDLPPRLERLLPKREELVGSHFGHRLGRHPNPSYPEFTSVPVADYFSVVCGFYRVILKVPRMKPLLVS